MNGILSDYKHPREKHAQIGSNSKHTDAPPKCVPYNHACIDSIAMV